MGKNIQDIINEIESGAIKECTQTYMEGVIVVDSIEDFMRKNNAIRLEDLEHSNKKKPHNLIAVLFFRVPFYRETCTIIPK